MNSGCRARRSGRHARVPFTAAQAAALEAAYARAPYLAPPALRALAAALQLRDDRVITTSLLFFAITGLDGSCLLPTSNELDWYRLELYFNYLCCFIVV
jgi:hypothetical protein